MVSGRKLRAPNGAMLHRKRRSPCDKLNSAYTTLARLRSGTLYSKTRQINAKIHFRYRSPNEQKRAAGRGYGRYGSRSGCAGHSGKRCVSLDPIGHWRCGDGDDRQLSIRLDLLRPRHSKEIRMGSRIDPVGLHLFVLFETWLVPIEGWFVDKYGPRLVVLAGGILCAIGWAVNAEATTLNGYYLGMIIAGIGAGGVYGTCVGNALKWFPDKRGLAAGITAAGFWAGLAQTPAPLPGVI